MRHAHIRQRRDRFLQQRHALLGREKSDLLRVHRDGQHDLIKDLRRAREHVEMSIGDRIEGACIDGAFHSAQSGGEGSAGQKESCSSARFTKSCPCRVEERRIVGTHRGAQASRLSAALRPNRVITTFLHPLWHADTKEFEALGEHTRGRVAQQQTRAARGFLGLQYGAAFEE